MDSVFIFDTKYEYLIIQARLCVMPINVLRFVFFSPPVTNLFTFFLNLHGLHLTPISLMQVLMTVMDIPHYRPPPHVLILPPCKWELTEARVTLRCDVRQCKSDHSPMSGWRSTCTWLYAHAFVCLVRRRETTKCYRNKNYRWFFFFSSWISPSFTISLCLFTGRLVRFDRPVMGLCSNWIKNNSRDPS